LGSQNDIDMRNIWLLLVSTVLLQCDSEDGNNCRLTRIFSQHISYDYSGRVYSSQQLDFENEIVEDGLNKVMEYDSDNRIIGIREYEGRYLFQYFTIEYLPAQIVQRKYMFNADMETTINSHETTFSLNSKGKILTIDRVDYITPMLSKGRETYEYDNRGNVIKIVFVSETHPETNLTHEFEYDKKLNPFRLVGFQIILGSDDIFSYQTQNRNNIIRRRTIYPDFELPFSETRYRYNEQGYPTHFLSNSSEIETFEYDCI
jgi:hypothetical protein